MKIALDDSSWLIVENDYLPKATANDLFKAALSDIPWEQSEITIFGKQRAIPRLNAWYGDHPYTYSGTTFPAKPLTPALLNLKKKIEHQFDIPLNSVLANLYRDGSDGMGWHSDNEKSLGAMPQIASISLGEPRRFLVRCKADKSNKTELTLEHGSLLLMRGDCQKNWEHSVPKTRRPKRARINLTFRYNTTLLS